MKILNDCCVKKDFKTERLIQKGWELRYWECIENNAWFYKDFVWTLEDFEATPLDLLIAYTKYYDNETSKDEILNLELQYKKL